MEQIREDRLAAGGELAEEIAEDQDFVLDNPKLSEEEAPAQGAEDSPKEESQPEEAKKAEHPEEDQQQQQQQQQREEKK